MFASIVQKAVAEEDAAEGAGEHARMTEAEGLMLHLSAHNATGYVGVYQPRGKRALPGELVTPPTISGRPALPPRQEGAFPAAQRAVRAPKACSGPRARAHAVASRRHRRCLLGWKK